MKKFVKNYIGKGKQVAGLEIIRVTCKLEDLQKYARFFDGIQYVTFEVAKMKQPDNYGRDYTVYVSQEEVTETPAPKQDKAPVRKSAKPKAKEAEPVAKDDLPF